MTNSHVQDSAYRILIKELRAQQKEIGKRIETIEEWINGKPTVSEETIHRSEAMKKSWAAKKANGLLRTEQTLPKKYNGTHWTQQPKNRKRMLARMKLMAKQHRRKMREKVND